MPMKYELQVPGLGRTGDHSRERRIASISELQRTFILTIIASVGLSMLLAIFRIRKRLLCRQRTINPMTQDLPPRRSCMPE